MHDTWYSVYVEAQAPPETPGSPRVSESVAESSLGDALMDLLEEHSGIVTAGERSWSATVSVPAENVRAAAEAGTVLVENMAAKAGMPSWPLVRSEAVREDVLEADNARPTLPEVVSAQEAAEILGVSRQRVHELAAGKDFPEPVYELRSGKLWLRAAVEAYAARRPRKPGRPARDHEQGSIYWQAMTVRHSRIPWPWSPAAKRNRDRAQTAMVYLLAMNYRDALHDGSWDADVPFADDPDAMRAWFRLWRRKVNSDEIADLTRGWAEPDREEIEIANDAVASLLQAGR